MNFKNSKAGFTLIELLIVMSITAILAAAGTVSYIGAIRRDQLDSYSKEIVSSLEKARTKAVNQEGGVAWGVFFQANTDPALSSYGIFQGDTPGAVFIDTRKLSNNVKFTSPDPNGAHPTDTIVFEKSTGNVKDGLDHLIQIGNGSNLKGIVIYKNGLIGPAEVLGTPLLVSPADGTVIGLATSQNLVWGEVAGAQTYRLQVSTDVNFGSLFFDNSSLTGTSYNVTGLQPYTVYYWRVQAYSLQTGGSLWSTPRYFGTLTVPDAPASFLCFPVL